MTKKREQKEIFIKCMNWHKQAAKELANPSIRPTSKLVENQFKEIAEKHEQRAKAIEEFIEHKWPKSQKKKG